jgi:antitoxin HicB
MGSSLSVGQQDSPGIVYGVRRHTGASPRFHQKIEKDTKRGPRPRPATAASPEEEGLNPAHLGSDFEDFLKEEGLFEAAQVLAVKKVIAYKLRELIRQKHLSKDALAKRMKTSRAALDRLLDPNNPSVTLATLGKAACVLGCTLHVELTHPEHPREEA